MGVLIHAKRMIDMIDAALDMLGPDAELLTEILRELGSRHARYGVKPQFFPFMGEALIEALEDTLGKETWTDEVEAAWTTVYDELSHDMMRVILEETS